MQSSSLLLVQASPRGARSVSRKLGVAYSEAWLAARPGARLVVRDLSLEPPALLDHPWVEAAFSPPGAPLSEAAKSSISVSNNLVDELLAADELAISTPIYNWSHPAVLKAWIDQLVRIGRTVGFGSDGLHGLVVNRPVRVLVASGADFSPEGAYWRENFLEPHLRTVFRYLGVTDLTFVYAGQQTGAAELASTHLNRALEEVHRLAQPAAA